MSEKKQLTQAEIDEIIRPKFDIDKNVIEYLEGYSDLKYVTKIELPYDANYGIVIIDDPETGRRVEHISYKPFVFIKDFSRYGYKLFDNENDRLYCKEKYGLSFKKLRITDKYGNVNQRLKDGYTYVVHSSKSMNDLKNFFMSKGYNFYNGEHKDLFHVTNNITQFCIQNGIRVFKGFDMYDDVHKLYFDIETTGLNYDKGDRIFLIGISDNKGYHKILEADRETFSEESELNMILDFFTIVYTINPSVIIGYNIEDFDFPFMLERYKLLTKNMLDKTYGELPELLKERIRLVDNFVFDIRRKSNTSLKVGGDTEFFTKTQMFGFSTVDTIHAVKRAKGINSDIKEIGLKYITKYLMNEGNIKEKKDRTYVDGDLIFRIWKENKQYVIDKNTNTFTELEEEYPFEEYNYEYYIDNIEESYNEQDRFFSDGFERENVDLQLTNGISIIEQYLLDDLWETKSVDDVFNEDSFLLTKLVPVNFDKKTIMGGSAMWTSLMECASYFNDIAIPQKPTKQDFTGGLSRLFKIGVSRLIQKLDYASLYPSLKLTYKCFPECDVENYLERFLTHFMNMRTHYKHLGKNKSLPKHISKMFKVNQLPFKIFNNSEFGATGSEYFPWGELDIAEFTTCSGRQYLRLLVKYFNDFGCDPLVLDTDGVNFSMPELYYKDCYGNKVDKPLKLDEMVYVDKHNKEYKGVNALIESFNDKLLFGDWMNLSDDGIWVSAINFARKNYTNLEVDNSIKFVGNSLKGSNIPKYIEEFIKNGIHFILTNEPKKFIDLYYETVYKIWNNDIPLIKIASKARVKATIDEYNNRGVNKNGKQKNKQAHMELLIQEKKKSSIGEVIYYINNGTSKSHSDVKIDNSTGKLISYLIDKEQMRKNKELRGEYNIDKYLDNFNNKVEIFLVCFKQKVREELIIKPKYEKIDGKRTKVLPERKYFTDEEMELSSFDDKEIIQEQTFDIGKKSKEDKIVDNLKDDLLTMEHKEIEFWLRYKESPNHIFDDYYTNFKEDNYYLINSDMRISETGVIDIDYKKIMKTIDFEDIKRFGTFLQYTPVKLDYENKKIQVLNNNEFTEDVENINIDRLNEVKNLHKQHFKTAINDFWEQNEDKYVYYIGEKIYFMLHKYSDKVCMMYIFEFNKDVNFIKGEHIIKSLKEGKYYNPCDYKYFKINSLYNLLKDTFDKKGLILKTEFDNVKKLNNGEFCIIQDGDKYKIVHKKDNKVIDYKIINNT